MERHLIASGYALTECGLTIALPRSLMTDVEDVDCQNCRIALINRGVCPACGEEKRLSWGTHPRNRSGVGDGRLRVSDVSTIFYLACDYCSATLIPQIDVDQVTTFLTEKGWVPWQGK
jgi:hypothetical protein